jgi:hypothetical protein
MVDKAPPSQRGLREIYVEFRAKRKELVNLRPREPEIVVSDEHKIVVRHPVLVREIEVMKGIKLIVSTSACELLFG